MLTVTLAIVVLMETLLRRTDMGIVLRAAVGDREGAGTLGISVKGVMWRSFAVGGALAAIAGLLLVPVTGASVSSGDSVAFFGFAGMAIGGFGSFAGALTGGLLVGLTTSLVNSFVNPRLGSTSVYVLMLLVLLVRPRGIFGAAGSFGGAKLREL
jgi:branched-subunit amino acid ABC-type transport system permease component